MALPNFNPANLSNLAGVLNDVLKNFSRSLENCIPAIVIEYNRHSNIATVQPAINIVTTNGESIIRDKIKLPVHVLGGGGLVVSVPLNAGDTGWIIAGDKDISLFKQDLKISDPNTERTHNFSFGFFIPDKIKNFNVSNSDVSKMLLQTLDGLTKIAIEQNLIEIITNQTLNVRSQTMNVISESNITGDVNLTGYLNVSTGATGTFASADNKTITVKNGIITGIN